MFKTVSTAAIAALIATSALAAAPPKTTGAVVKGGQYVGATQYTGLIDPDGLCAGVAGLAVGQNTSSVASITGLGATWTSTIANANPTPSAPYGVGWINCQFPALPAASAFVATTIGTATEYVATPTDVETTSCLASNGTPYTLTSSNTTVGGEAQTLTVTVLPVNTGGKDYGFRLTSGNSALSVNGNTICFLSTDAVYLNGSK
jgi:hypothetical protein